VQRVAVFADLHVIHVAAIDLNHHIVVEAKVTREVGNSQVVPIWNLIIAATMLKEQAEESDGLII